MAKFKVGQPSAKKDWPLGLDVDFIKKEYKVNGVQKSFAELFTYSRASTATYWDADGVLQTAAVNEPRFVHDPVTGKPLGILGERQVTNLIADNTTTISDAFVPMASDEVMPHILRYTVPEGVVNGEGNIQSGGSNYPGGNVVPNSGCWQRSLFFKQGGAKHVRIGGSSESGAIVFDTETLEIHYTGAQVTFAKLTPYKGGWVLAQVSAATNNMGVAAQFQFRAGNTNSGGSVGIGSVGGDYIDIAYPMMLDHAQPTETVIPTFGSQVTRAADQLKIDGVNFSDWFNASEGTLLVDVEILPNQESLAQSSYWGLVDVAHGKYGRVRADNSGLVRATDVGVTANLSPTQPVPYSAVGKRYVFGWAKDSTSVSVSGVSAYTTTQNLDLSKIAMMVLAGWSYESDSYNQYIRHVAFIPRKLTDAEIQAWSAL